MNLKNFLWADPLVALFVLACWGYFGHQMYTTGNWGEEPQAKLTSTRIESMYMDLERYQSKKDSELQDLRYQLRDQ